MFRKSSRSVFLLHKGVGYVKVVLRRRISRGWCKRSGTVLGNEDRSGTGHYCQFVWSPLLTRCRCDRNEHREQAVPSLLGRRKPAAAAEENAKPDERSIFSLAFLFA